jgi:hypothetical protein
MTEIGLPVALQRSVHSLCRARLATSSVANPKREQDALALLYASRPVCFTKRKEAIVVLASSLRAISRQIILAHDGFDFTGQVKA